MHIYTSFKIYLYVYKQPIEHGGKKDVTIRSLYTCIHYYFIQI